LFGKEYSIQPIGLERRILIDGSTRSGFNLKEDSIGEEWLGVKNTQGC